MDIFIQQHIHHIGIAIAVAIIISAVLYFATPTNEGWEWVSAFWNRVTLHGKSETETVTGLKSHAAYKTQCMTQKPCGGPSAMYRYFKAFESEMPKKYKHCSRMECSTKKFNGLTAKPHEQNSRLSQSFTKAHSISVDYYHDPVGYCSQHPDRYPCPNFWMKDGQVLTCPVSLKIPKMKDHILPQATTFCHTGNLHELSRCDVNDNDRALILYPGKEDKSLC